MIELYKLSAFLDELLTPAVYQDYCPNGIQVEASTQVSLLVTGVTASQALIEAAAGFGADALLVHHGYFWKGEPPSLVGIKGRRIAALIRSGISLLAYHLPLDAHPVFGNNRRLAERLEIVDPQPARAGGLIWVGRLGSPAAGEELGQRIAERLGAAPLHITGNGRPIRQIAWCSGAAQDLLPEAAALGVDAYLTGEASERTVHEARELGIHFFAAGHHATERFGVQALGGLVAKEFGIEHRFVDIPNPV